MIVMHKHLKAMRYCNNGTRDFFKRHNIDWSLFMKNGVEETVLLATGDTMAVKLVDYARKEQSRG